MRAIRPGRGLITTIRSASSVASWIECVTKTIVLRCSPQIRCSSRLSSSRVSASSAANGSSIRSTDGSWTSARQSATRCCMPPDSSYGLRLSNPSSPASERSSSARTRSAPLVELQDLGRQQHVLDHVPPRQQRGALEHQADVAPRCVDACAVHAHLAGARRQQARDDPEQRRLAAAGAPDERDELALPHLEVDVVERVQALAAAAKDLGDRVDGDGDGIAHRCSWPAHGTRRRSAITSA